MPARTFLKESLSELLDREGFDALSRDDLAGCLDELEAKFGTETHPLVPRLWTVVDRLRRPYLQLPDVVRMPRVQVFDDGSARQFDAFACLDRVYVSVKLDRLPDAELAFVVAHELGHVFHGDCEAALAYAQMSLPATLAQRIRRRLSSQAREHQADAFARELVTTAGFPDASTTFFERMLVNDRRTEVRWNGIRRVPFVGRALDRLRRAAESMKYSHPSAEERLERARQANSTPEPPVEHRCWETPIWLRGATTDVGRCRHPGQPRCGHNLASSHRPRVTDYW